jgi:hypothetical protein
MPSLKYSALESELAFTKGRTASDWIEPSRGRKKKNHAATNPKPMIATTNPICALAQSKFGERGLRSVGTELSGPDTSTGALPTSSTFSTCPIKR